MNLILLAAGKGTRFYPLTKTIPKAMVPILQRPLIEYVLDPFLPHISKIICVINKKTGPILKKFLGSHYKTIPVVYVFQVNKEQRGTWASAVHALPYLSISDKYFCVTNCDDLFSPQDISLIFSKKITSGMGITKSFMPYYYLSITQKKNMIAGFTRNTPRKNKLVSGWFSNGFYILPRKFFALTPQKIAGGELGLPQTLFTHLDELPLKAFPIKHWQAVNGPEDIAQATSFIKTHYNKSRIPKKSLLLLAKILKSAKVVKL